MSRITRPELSESNRYYIDKNRYYELKYFCKQYTIWKKSYEALTGLSARPNDLIKFCSSGISNPTEQCALARESYSAKINMIDKACEETDEILGRYILQAIIDEKSYEHLRTNYNIPCGKNAYYTLYRKFFWVLNRLRD